MLFLLGMVVGRVADGVFGMSLNAATKQVGRRATEQIVERLRTGRVELPQNHDLLRAHQTSFVSASRFLLGSAGTADLPRVGAVRRTGRRLAGGGLTADLDLERGGEEAAWCRAFDERLEAADGFDAMITLSDAGLGGIGAARVEVVVQERFHAEYLSWVDGLGLGAVPERIRTAILEGWAAEAAIGDHQGKHPEPTADGAPSITVFEAYCLFFQHLIATDDLVRRKIEMHARYLAGRAVADAQEKAGLAADDPGTEEEPTWSAHMTGDIRTALQELVGPAFEGLARRLLDLEEQLALLADAGEEGFEDLRTRTDVVVAEMARQNGDLAVLIELGAGSEAAARAAREASEETLERVRDLARSQRLQEELLEQLARSTTVDDTAIERVGELLRGRVLFSTERLEVPIQEGSGAVTLPLDLLEVGALPIARSRPIAEEDDGSMPSHSGRSVARGREETGDHLGALLAADGGEELRLDGRVLLVGGPGTGKSTALRWIARREASAGRPVVLVSCRDLRGESLTGAPAAIVGQQVRALGLASEAVAIAAIAALVTGIEDGSVALLIDGLDELPGAGTGFADQFAAWLNDAGQHARICLTSRGDGRDRAARAIERGLGAVRADGTSTYPLAVISDLAHAQREALIDAWSEAWSRRDLAPVVTLLDEDTSDAADRTARYEPLKARVLDDGALAHLAGTVMMLSLICQTHELTRTHWGAQLPLHRRELYQQLTDLLIERGSDRLAPEVGPPIEVAELVPRLEVLALAMLEADQISIAEDEALRALRRFDESFDTADFPALAPRRPVHEVLQLARAVGLLVDAGPGPVRRGVAQRRLEFYHRSFQEYFAGRALHHGWYSPVEPSAAAIGAELGTRLLAALREPTSVEAVIEPGGRWFEPVRHALESIDGTPCDPAMTQDPRSEPVDHAMRALLAAGVADRAEARTLAEVAVQAMVQTVSPTFDLIVEVLGVVHLDLGPETPSGWVASTDAAVRQLLGRCSACELVELLLTVPAGASRPIAALIIDLVSPYKYDPEADLDALVDTATRDLKAAEAPEDVARSAMRLVQLGFGAMSSLPNEERGVVSPPVVLPGVSPDTVASALYALLDRVVLGSPTSSLASWGVLWMVAAPRVRGDAAAVTAGVRARIRELLALPFEDAHLVADLALVLAVGGQPSLWESTDWLHDWAEVADGIARHADLTDFDELPVDPDCHLVQAAVRRLGDRATWRGALAAARLGCTDRALIGALAGPMVDSRMLGGDRDEALYHLVRIGGADALPLLVPVARMLGSDPDSPTDHVAGRALLAIVGIGDVDGIVALLGSSSTVPGYDAAYLRTLATMADRRGSDALAELARSHPAERVRVDAERIARDQA